MLIVFPVGLLTTAVIQVGVIDVKP